MDTRRNKNKVELSNLHGILSTRIIEIACSQPLFVLNAKPRESKASACKHCERRARGEFSHRTPTPSLLGCHSHPAQTIDEKYEKTEGCEQSIEENIYFICTLKHIYLKVSKSSGTGSKDLKPWLPHYYLYIVPVEGRRRSLILKLKTQGGGGRDFVFAGKTD